MPALEQIINRLADVGNAGETAYAVLREAIITNILKPGMRLRADELAKKLGVSRTPVREALRKLEAENLIAVQGTALSVKVLTEEQLFEIYYTREALEGMAARLAAENAGQIEIANLRAILDEIKVHAADRKQLRALTGKFQLALFRSARNETLFRLLKHLQEQVRQYAGTTLTQPGRTKEVLAYCKSIFAAVEQRDPDKAEKIARANRRRTLELRIRMLRGGANRSARLKPPVVKPTAFIQTGK
jgi:DNA-binding GntR family transcriptional regulator